MNRLMIIAIGATLLTGPCFAQTSDAMSKDVPIHTRKAVRHRESRAYLAAEPLVAGSDAIRRDAVGQVLAPRDDPPPSDVPALTH